MQIAMDLHIIS